LADATPLGQDVWAVGTPLSTDLELSIAKGIVSGRRTLEGRPFVQTDAAISPGYSGGPLVSPDGRAVGVINSKIVGAGTEGVGFAVPSAEARAQLGIAFAAETADALPEAVTALPARPSLPTLEDVDDPLFRDTMTAAQREPLARRSRGQITGGIVLVVAGVAASAASTAVWASDEGKTQGQFAGLRAADATGWLVALSGTALAIRGGVRLAQLPDE
ncbi:MAG: trypsin-like peptidase domain-containing protein, partial [Myxococcota bacterium]